MTSVNVQKLDLPSSLRTVTAVQFKLAPSDSAAGVIEGYGSTFNGAPDRHGDIIAPGAFAASIAAHKAAGTLPSMLWCHNIAQPIGRWTEVVEDRKGLFCRGQLNLDTKMGAEVHAHLKAGDVGGLSIGFRNNPGSIASQDDGSYLLTSIDLLEISVVTIPANPSARVTGVKAFGSKGELEEILRKAGLPSRAVQKLMLGGWLALSAKNSGEGAALIAAIRKSTQSLKEKANG